MSLKGSKTDLSWLNSVCDLLTFATYSTRHTSADGHCLVEIVVSTCTSNTENLVKIAGMVYQLCAYKDFRAVFFQNSKWEVVCFAQIRSLYVPKDIDFYVVWSIEFPFTSTSGAKSSYECQLQIIHQNLVVSISCSHMQICMCSLSS